MADLIRTIDDDDEVAHDSEAESGEDAAPALSKQDRFNFTDLLSEAEDDDRKGKSGWDFDSHQTVAAGGEEQAGGLEAKIRQRRQEAGLEADSNGSKKERKEKKQKDRQAVDTSHLETNMHFADLRLSRPLLRAVAELRFSSPTPIQRDVIPPALRGLDILATAETGSGKTASFLLPALERLCQSPNVRVRRRDSSGRILTGPVGTKAMVLIPTRELAVQCHAMLENLAKYTLVTYQLVAGGFVSQEQATSLRRQPDIVVATPGRLLDHLLNSPSVHMELLEIVVFDEADRLLELGFKEECMEVLKRCSKGRQTMLFSATLSDSVEDLAALALVKPVRVHANPANKVAQTLEQEFVKSPSQDDREAVLMSLCERNYSSNVIIFCATKHAAHRIAIILGLSGFRFSEIHGNLAQGDRVKGLQRFQQGDADFLVATDLAARGLDLANVDTVINFHLPADTARYVHRVGRTARMGRAGRAVTIYCPDEYAKVKKLGKDCCSKVNATVQKRTVASDAVKEWATKIAGLEGDIKSILEDESMERELRVADMLTEKSQNLQRYKAEINARGERQWYMSNREKAKLKASDAERVRSKAEDMAGEAKPEPAPGSKKRKNEETREERYQRRLQERQKQQREAEKAEREEDMRRVRRAARRGKKNMNAQSTAGGPKKKGGSKNKKGSKGAR